MDVFRQDLRFAVRTLLRTPGFALVAVLTLGIGIGANTAIFSFVDALVLRPLPYEDADRLMMVWQDERARGGPEDEWTSPPNFHDWREQARSFDELAAFTGAAYTISGRGEAERLDVGRVSGGFFSVLRTQPVLGRGLSRADEAAGTRVAVLSHGLWQRRFGGDAGVIGANVTLEGDSYTVVGVLPADFRFPFLPSAELYMPLTDIENICGRRCIFLRVVGRMAPGVTEAQARTEVEAIGRNLAEAHPENRNVALAMTSMHEEVAGPIRPAMILLLGSVGFLLLIACANVANLLLAQAARREGEIAVRSALGAAGGRLARQLLTESIVLALAGGLVGVVLGVWCVDLLMALLPAEAQGVTAVELDGTVLLFTAAITVGTGLAFGLAPALQAARRAPALALREGGRSGGEGRRQRRVRGALVVTEIALALVLMTGAGLMLRSLLFLQRVDMGFRTENLLTSRLSLPSARYTPEEVPIFWDRLLERIETAPGVRSAAAVSMLPLGGGINDGAFLVEGQPEPEPGQRPPVALISSVTPDYFETMGIALRSGRAFTEQDREGAPPVVVVDETLARRHFGGEDPVGKRIIRGDGPIEIVGVVAAVRHSGPITDLRPMLYFPHTQRRAGGMSLVVRTEGDPLAAAGPLRAELRALDPELAASSMLPAEELLEQALAQPRLLSYLLGLFAFVALALACFGIYGVMSYSVAQRTREMGLRMALGADQGSVLGLVVRQGMRLAVIGLGIGALAALGLTRLMQGLLFGTSPADPMTFATVVALLGAVALAACYVPARRATRVDPMTSLRNG